MKSCCFNLKLVYGAISMLFVLCITLQSALAQIESDSAFVVPDVSSNISEIMTPDLPNNLVEEDSPKPINQPAHKLANDGHNIVSNTSSNFIPPLNETFDATESSNITYSLNQTNMPGESNSTVSKSSNLNQLTETSNSLNNVSNIFWNNFTSGDRYSFSYPRDWNLTTADNEVYIESNDFDSDFYPKMTISIRHLDPNSLNNTISDLFPVEGISNDVIYSSFFDSKILSNVGLKYFIDLDYVVLEPTQEGKYVIDGKQSSSFKVHELGDYYENEHITVKNNDKIYSIEINSDYFPSSDREANQLDQIKETVLRSIKWLDNQTNPAIEESKLMEKDDGDTNVNNETKNAPSLPNSDADDNKTHKTISSSDHDLNITSSTDFFDDESFKVVGEVQNKGPKMRHLVEVVITLYDRNNNMMGTELTYTNPTDLSPQQSAPFEIMINPGDVRNVSDIRSYKLFITALDDQPQQYTKTPSISSQNVPSSENAVSMISEDQSQVLNEGEFAINATLSKGNKFGSSDKSYSVKDIDFKFGPRNSICPENSCEFEIREGRIGLLTAHQYVFSGTLVIITHDQEGKRSKLMYMHCVLNIGEILEKDGIETEKLAGKFDIGPSISYAVTNSSLTHHENNATLALFGKEI